MSRPILDILDCLDKRLREPRYINATQEARVQGDLGPPILEAQDFNLPGRPEHGVNDAGHVTGFDYIAVDSLIHGL